MKSIVVIDRGGIFTVAVVGSVGVGVAIGVGVGVGVDALPKHTVEIKRLFPNFKNNFPSDIYVMCIGVCRRRGEGGCGGGRS